MSIPSVTELTLLKCLWKQQSLSARELHQQVEAELQWSYSSTRKTLERMVEKDMLVLQTAHGINVYKAKLEKIETLAAFTRDFGRRVMELDEPLPVNMFTGSKLVSHAELAELEQLLHDWPNGRE
ncbi:MAG: BlaI/MecI/CopY family transcriptional regulator [Janthinobacterium lividum]